MNLIGKLKQFIARNVDLLSIIILFSVLGYGYFITNWTISLDSEREQFLIAWIKQGRFLIPILHLIDNFHIVPFIDDALAVIVLICSAIIWMITISGNGENQKTALLTFSLVYIISPIYVFYLRFTTYNIAIGCGILFISLSIYYLVESLNSLIKKNKTHYLLISGLYVFFAVCIYQMFVIYFFTALLFIILFRYANKDSFYYFRNILSELFIGILVLLVVLILYKLLSIIIYHFIPQSDYTDKFVMWGKKDVIYILYSLKSYFYTIFFKIEFNFMVCVTLGFAILHTLLLLISNPKKNMVFILFYLAFLLSPFIMPIAFGSSLPLRTLQPVPLMLAGVWVILFHKLNYRLVNRGIFLFVLLCTLWNAGYITRLFYGDNMRLEYDKKLANQLYSYILSNTGSSIYSKPLIIIGYHAYKDRGFILKSPFDALGYSFFEICAGIPQRIYDFMQWLGNDTILASQKEQDYATSISYDMPNYPVKGSLKETESMIIVKLSNPRIDSGQQPISLNLSNGKYIYTDKINLVLDNLNVSNGKITYWGWGYIRYRDSLDNQVFIKFISLDNKEYLFPVNNSTRPEINKFFHDGKNLQYSSFNGVLNKSILPKSTYKVNIIILNHKDYAIYKSNKTIIIN